MCGIIGAISNTEASAILIDGLKRLEYRGYDSAGIATLKNGGIDRRRAEGKISNLEVPVEQNPVSGTTGIGHTRWATHGAPTEMNAHPHADERVVLVHNGIIENFRDLRNELSADGHRFETETDTEAVVHLISSYLENGLSPSASVKEALERLEGAFALAILFAGYHDYMVVARRGSPLAIGYGNNEMFIGSDAIALAPLTDKITYLEEGDWAEINGSGCTIRDEGGAIVQREVQETSAADGVLGKGNFPHFMLKEIYEQPAVIGDTLHTILGPLSEAIKLPELPFAFQDVSRVMIAACGTSYHAGLVARYWFESVAGLPTEIDIASEFRYRDIEMAPGGLAVFISQSGETADTLAALRSAKDQGQYILSIVNVPESSMARESDIVIQTKAGPEIGVASTKAFTTQLTTLACLAVGAGVIRGKINGEKERALCDALTAVPSRAVDVLKHDGPLQELAQEVAQARDVLYLGRGTGFPIALEGALKLKEISYLHAEGYAAGEMKHGPISLIDEDVPVIVIAPSDALFSKTASNMQEVVARGGRVIFLSDNKGIDRLGDLAATTIELPTVNPFVAPILYTIPVQLLAYHVAVIKGTDVDQPRNLAKSVTVE